MDGGLFHRPLPLNLISWIVLSTGFMGLWSVILLADWSCTWADPLLHGEWMSLRRAAVTPWNLFLSRNQWTGNISFPLHARILCTARLLPSLKELSSSSVMNHLIFVYRTSQSNVEGPYICSVPNNPNSLFCAVLSCLVLNLSTNTNFPFALSLCDFIVINCSEEVDKSCIETYRLPFSFSSTLTVVSFSCKERKNKGDG